MTRCRGGSVMRAFYRGELSLYRGLEQVGQSDSLEEQVLQILWCLLQEEMGSDLGSCLQTQQRMGADAEERRRFRSAWALVNNVSLSNIVCFRS